MNHYRVKPNKRVNQTAYNAADQATDTLADRLMEDFVKQGL